MYFRHLPYKWTPSQYLTPVEKEVERLPTTGKLNTCKKVYG
jgi:hypothetical protein